LFRHRPVIAIKVKLLNAANPKILVKISQAKLGLPFEFELIPMAFLLSYQGYQFFLFQTSI